MKILFQGDSITDAGRSRENDAMLGVGYPLLLSAMLGERYPGRFSVVNRGVSGNRVVDLYARWRVDAINLAPDLISILIGVNDVWHSLAFNNGVEADRFEQVYDMLLDYTRRCLPNARILLLEPFVLPGCATVDALDFFQREVALRAQAARRVAERAGVPSIDLQSVFDEALEHGPADCWLADGVHPTPAGHWLIANRWLRAVTEMGWLAE